MLPWVQNHLSSVQGLSQPLVQTFSSGMFCRSHHQSKVKKCSFSKIFTRLLLPAVGEKIFLPGLLVFFVGLVFCLLLRLFFTLIYYFYSFCLNVRTWNMATPPITLSVSQQSNLWKPYRIICSLGLSYGKQILKDRSHKAFLLDLICVISVCSLI